MLVELEEQGTLLAGKAATLDDDGDYLDDDDDGTFIPEEFCYCLFCFIIRHHRHHFVSLFCYDDDKGNYSKLQTLRSDYYCLFWSLFQIKTLFQQTAFF
jgi:hypothetical protein